nr:UvrD-like helicase, ATP-binding domain, P-loop containing nucleoside triphosphate hydrolase [Tanacetum cinerariifolium]
SISEDFKIIFRGKVYWIRAKETPGWVHDFADAYEDKDSDDAISNDEGDKNQNSNIFGDDDDAEDGREHQVNEDPIEEGEEDKQGMENNNTQGKEDATGLNKNDKESVQPKHIEEVSDS